jgi:hypothetical protein
VDAFTEFVGWYREAGIEEFILGYWTQDDVPAGAPLQHIAEYEMLERIATEAIPTIRQSEPAWERPTPRCS